VWLDPGGFRVPVWWLLVSPNVLWSVINYSVLRKKIIIITLSLWSGCHVIHQTMSTNKEFIRCNGVCWNLEPSSQHHVPLQWPDLNGSISGTCATWPNWSCPIKLRLAKASELTHRHVDRNVLRPNDAELIASLTRRHVTRPVIAFLVLFQYSTVLGSKDGRLHDAI